MYFGFPLAIAFLRNSCASIGLADSLRPDKRNGYHWLTTITAAVGNDDYRFGTADIRTIDERLELIGLKEGKPQVQVAYVDYAFGRIDEISKHTQWKAVKGEQTEKTSIPLFEYNLSGKWFVGPGFVPGGDVNANAGGNPLSVDSIGGVRLLRKLE